ncbi:MULTISPECIES: DUF308 domain-containing protein [Cytobacillus]|uniref:DUF308 domain-containing protein n=1 Tax=Cytobacillus stercorigallinarum TaxID=2762240 RepID=A0ABR8QJY8_9BACI|nr:DUF308 domain-containing protein [Cytobacillus stercorigallinarum]MBD7935838.1 DUF308 domain-containing protein [Cytobacillus stercorigallinarum]
MADQMRKNDEDQLRRDKVDENQYEVSSDYSEETAAEIAAPVTYDEDRGRDIDDRKGTRSGGRGVGITALVLSILSLFIMPIFLGAAGIVLGIIANSKGARGFGTWAIGIGIVSLLVGIFIMPFF